jgi:uncharacterized membrane protein YagU involved in acid resistance
MGLKTKQASDFFWQSPVKVILLSGFVAGTIDILAALLVYSVIIRQAAPIEILQFIGSAVFGKSAFAGGMIMAVYGLLFHYLISFSFAIAYFLIFPYISFLQKNRIVDAILYGIFTWFIMNVVVLPLVFSNRAPIELYSAIRDASILVVTIGLPVSFITYKYYASRV